MAIKARQSITKRDFELISHKAPHERNRTGSILRSHGLNEMSILMLEMLCSVDNLNKIIDSSKKASLRKK